MTLKALQSSLSPHVSRQREASAKGLMDEQVNKVQTLREEVFPIDDCTSAMTYFRSCHLDFNGSSSFQVFQSDNVAPVVNGAGS